MDPEETSRGAGTERPLDVEDVDPLTLDEALSIVGEETRARILLELGNAVSEDGVTPKPLGFTEVMERVGVEDSGLFNYHLDALDGTFVEKREEGYVLRYPGLLVQRAIVAGTLTDRRSIEPFPVGDCPTCDGRLHATYRPDHLLTVGCDDCETLVDAMHVPARAIEGRSGEAFLDAAYRRRFAELGALRRGVCHGCGGRVERDLAFGSTGELADVCDRNVHATLRCVGCNTSALGNPAYVALTAPTVVGFFADHDRDPALARWWAAPIYASMQRVSVVEENPFLVSTTYVFEGDRLRVAVNDDLQVVESERFGA